MGIQGLLQQTLGYGVNLHGFTQSADMLKGWYCRRLPAFEDWIRQLSSGDKLPRGSYFSSKKLGKPLYIVNEFWY
ncbi:MAG: hypothetical protein FT726_26235 [Pantoea sp. Morm]|jgi:hypothetical protein|nr:hypothetical protein [Pantoea sp. Morm]